MGKITVNTAKGFDVMRGQKIIKHFDTKEDAQKSIDGKHGYYIRYWIEQEEGDE